MGLLRGNECRVLADATVELVSRTQRPFVFLVTVTGLPPHAVTRRYNVTAPSDDSAAMKGLQVFEQEMSLVAKIDTANLGIPLLDTSKALKGVRFR